MTAFDFGELEIVDDFEWKKRGRKPQPLDPRLVEALRASFGTGSTPKLVMPLDKVNTFYNLLSKAGRQLNYRINREVEENVPEEGLATYHFKVIGLRDKDGINE